MAIDFFWLGEIRETPLATLGFKALATIEPAIIQLESKTGVFLDPYADTRICYDHAVILLNAIRNQPPPKNAEVAIFKKLLEEFTDEEKWLIGIGD